MTRFWVGNSPSPGSSPGQVSPRRAWAWLVGGSAGTHVRGLAWNRSAVLSVCQSVLSESLDEAFAYQGKERKAIGWHCHIFLHFPIEVSLLLLQVVETRRERCMLSVHVCLAPLHTSPGVGSRLLGDLL